MALIDSVKAGAMPNTLSQAQKMIRERDAALLAAEELANCYRGMLQEIAELQFLDDENTPIECGYRQKVLTAYRQATGAA